MVGKISSLVSSAPSCGIRNRTIAHDVVSHQRQQLHVDNIDKRPTLATRPSHRHTLVFVRLARVSFADNRSVAHNRVKNTGVAVFVPHYQFQLNTRSNHPTAASWRLVYTRSRHSDRTTGHNNNNIRMGMGMDTLAYDVVNRVALFESLHRDQYTWFIPSAPFSPDNT